MLSYQPDCLEGHSDGKIQSIRVRVSGVGSRMPAAPLPAPLARTKGLPVDASEMLPDALVKKWQSEKVEI